MIEVRTRRYIEHPPAATFAFISDASNNPRWQNGMVSCRWTSAPPIGEGSTYDQEARFLGRPIISRFRIVAHEPGRLIKGTTTESSFPITFTRIVEPEGTGSRVSAIIEGDASGLFRLAEPLLRRMVQRSVDNDYQQLKRLLEQEKDE